MPKSQPLTLISVGLATMVAAKMATADEYPEVSDALFGDMPVVLTAARLKQPVNEVPATITIIDQDMIRQSGARSLPEVLRLVPGIHLGYDGGFKPLLGYHGLIEDISRRMQVLIDGRSVFEPALARIEWNNIPLALQDILRIEVTRGPNTAAYGANAFFGVVNIITVQPVDVVGVDVAITRGDKDIQDGFVRYAADLGQSQYRLTVGHREDSGFDLEKQGQTRHDSYQRHYLNGEWQRSFSSTSKLRLSFGASEGEQQIEDLDDFEVAPYHYQENTGGFVQVDWQSDLSEHHQRKIQAYLNYSDQTEQWESCIPTIMLSQELRQLFDTDANYTNLLVTAIGSGQPPPPPPNAQVAALLPSVYARYLNGGSALNCGVANQNLLEQRADVEWQETYVFNEAFRLVGGLSARAESAKAETYFMNKRSNTQWRAFANMEWRLNEDWIANIGGMFENDQLIGTEFSPRVAINWHAHAQHTLRAVVARAIRSPDLFEESGQFDYRLQQLDMPVNGSDPDAYFYIHSQSPGDLGVEEILSKELGLNSRLFNNQLSLDIKVFDDELRHVIEGAANLFNFDLANRGYMDQQGYEVQLDYQPNRDWRVFAGYSELQFDHASISRYERSSADSVSQALVSRRWAGGPELSLTWYGMQDFWNKDYQLLGFKAAYPIALSAQTRLTLSLVWQWRLEENYYFDDNNREKDYNYGWLNAQIHF